MIVKPLEFSFLQNISFPEMYENLTKKVTSFEIHKNIEKKIGKWRNTEPAENETAYRKTKKS